MTPAGFRPRFALLMMGVLLAGLAVPGAGRAAVPDAFVSLPPDPGIHGHALWDSWFDLSGFGYTEQEYFVSGTARTVDGTQTAPYTTRMIVTRPSTHSFNGTVVLDWVNVTAQFENAVDTIETHEMMLREGFAWVHASVQSAGVCCSPLTPKVWDPVRYETLSHPGDAYAADILSQMAKALRTPAGLDPMAGLAVSKVIAVGQSQSASRLDSYVRDVQPAAGVIDGFLIHGGGSKTYATPPAVPVVHLLSDMEASAAAPNTSINYRLWEIAGTAHSDFWIGYHQVFGQGPRTLLHAPKQPSSAEDALDAVAGTYGEVIHPLEAVCIVAGATMPMHYAASAALYRLDQWVKTGVAPPNGPRFAFSGGVLAKDVYGNTLGGIRLPPIDVPLARYLSTGCPLGGLTLPFTDGEIALLYPSHAGYYAQMVARTGDAVAAGWLLADDAADLLARACAAKVRWLSGEAGC